MTYEYDIYIKESSALLEELEGAYLKSILINVVEPEFNVVYLDTDKGIFSVQGEIGGEYLGVHKLDELPELTNQEGYIICEYPPFEVFVGKRISQARHIGTAWNGHGYEFSFDGMYSKTMIVQSIYSGSKPSELEDCLRLGVGCYENVWNA